MRGRCAIVHNICKKKQRIIIFGNALYFSANHCYPFIKNLFKVIRRYLCANDIAIFNGSFYGAYKLIFVRFYFKTYKVCTYMCRYCIKSFLRICTGTLAPLNCFLGKEGQHIFTLHYGCFFSIDYH